MDPVDQIAPEGEVTWEVFPDQAQDVTADNAGRVKPSVSDSVTTETENTEESSERNLPLIHHALELAEMVSEPDLHKNDATTKAVEMIQRADNEIDVGDQLLTSGSNSSSIADSVVELETVKKDMKMMETALQGAARQAQIL
ncbi:hypothetical protein ACH5RR_008056 [Cinchona calisaya]|uniref:Uncharacterized protein n=1 Tax=Cinchona calisaya TaxID=153742 RepID=A0ABD3AAI1_9GENT